MTLVLTGCSSSWGWCEVRVTAGCLLLLLTALRIIRSSAQCSVLPSISTRHCSTAALILTKTIPAPGTRECHATATVSPPAGHLQGPGGALCLVSDKRLKNSTFAPGRPSCISALWTIMRLSPLHPSTVTTFRRSVSSSHLQNVIDSATIEIKLDSARWWYIDRA